MLRQAAARYEDMIVKDPDFTSKLESALKVASFLIPGAHYKESLPFFQLTCIFLS